MRAEAVGAGKVNQLDNLIINLEQANVTFDGHARIVTNALPQTGQAIEKRALSRIRTADNRDADIWLPASWNVVEKYAGFGCSSHRYRDASQ